MKLAAKLLFLIGIVLLFNSCFEAEVFPSAPQIEYESLRFVDTDGTDSLILSFRFQDGEGDIGLTNEPSDFLKPFQVFSVVIDSEDSVVSISQQNLALPLFTAPVLVSEEGGETSYFFFPEEKEFFSDVDNRPPYNCEFYELINNDTFYVARNEFHENFHIEFLEKPLGSDKYEVIDFQEIFNSDDCTLGNFNGRIPWFDPNGKEGTITYAMLSRAFRLAFQDDSIKLRFYIYDRALNQSNTVESPGFIFTDLL